MHFRTTKKLTYTNFARWKHSGQSLGCFREALQIRQDRVYCKISAKSPETSRDKGQLSLMRNAALFFFASRLLTAVASLSVKGADGFAAPRSFTSEALRVQPGDFWLRMLWTPSLTRLVSVSTGRYAPCAVWSPTLSCICFVFCLLLNERRFFLRK